jgi:hypothetical protein
MYLVSLAGGNFSLYSSSIFLIEEARCSIEDAVKYNVVTCSLPEGDRQKSFSENIFLFQDIEKLFTRDIIIVYLS